MKVLFSSDVTMIHKIIDFAWFGCLFPLFILLIIQLMIFLFLFFSNSSLQLSRLDKSDNIWACKAATHIILKVQTFTIPYNQYKLQLLSTYRKVGKSRGVPERVHPFSKGICRNLYNFCCSRDSPYALESVPRSEELQARARPYTCSDLMSCRCL